MLWRVGEHEALTERQWEEGRARDAIAKIVDMPFGRRPFRVHVDPTQDGAEVAFTVIDRMRTDMLHRVGLDELLIPVNASPDSRPEQ